MAISLYTRLRVFYLSLQCRLSIFHLKSLQPEVFRFQVLGFFQILEYIHTHEGEGMQIDVEIDWPIDQLISLTQFIGISSAFYSLKVILCNAVIFFYTENRTQGWSNTEQHSEPLFYLETESHKLPKLGLNLQSSCISLLSAGIPGLQHHAWRVYLHFDCDHHIWGV